DFLRVGFDSFLHGDPSSGQYLVDGHADNRLGQHPFGDGFNVGRRIIDLKKVLRRIADDVLQNEGSIDDVGVSSHQLHAGRHGRFTDGYRKSHTDFFHAGRLDDVKAINGPGEAVMHAGADLGLDGTKPTHHRALVRLYDIEAGCQISSQKKANDGEDP